ncbi:hypothetical protein NSPZN2_40707 [Nitrospira defluvii]|uniref:Uncharacterized protein n=1 Tax=Nitrospira defluvii TaxID=330214 RepID=A0ABM8RZ99_9BACT|nr:hypothetical protein NSPZN2_40707 [Nitrospira defluvii]
MNGRLSTFVQGCQSKCEEYMIAGIFTRTFGGQLWILTYNDLREFSIIPLTREIRTVKRRGGDGTTGRQDAEQEQQAFIAQAPH